MIEKQFWAGFVRPALHDPQTGRAAWKIQDSVNRGIPDGLCIDRGRVALVEVKYIPAWPKRETTEIKVNLSPEQRRRLEEWKACGGRAFVVLGVEKVWFAIDIAKFKSETLLLSREQLYFMPCGKRATLEHHKLRAAIYGAEDNE